VCVEGFTIFLYANTKVPLKYKLDSNLPQVECHYVSYQQFKQDQNQLKMFKVFPKQFYCSPYCTDFSDILVLLFLGVIQQPAYEKNQMSTTIFL